MELRKFLAVFLGQKNLFLTILVLPLVATLLYTLTRPVDYQSTLTLTIIRSEANLGAEVPTDADEYDSYYRFSADEKFAQTIGQWLVSPSIADAILRNSNVRTQDLSAKDLENEFSVVQRSPQVINVQYKSPSPEVATAKAQAMTQILNERTDQLNKTANSQSWFTVQAGDPLTRQIMINLPLIISTSLIIGFCLAILGTLLRFYYTKED